MPLVPPDPPLGDERVLLRPLVTADREAITRACQDPAIQRFIPVPRPYGPDDAADYIDRSRRHWAEGSKATFAITGRDDPDLLLGVINLAVAVPVGNSGYWVSPTARGTGFATRALRAVARWAFDTLELGVVLLEIRPENGASIAVAEAAGFHRAGRLDVNTATGKKGGLLYSRLATDR